MLVSRTAIAEYLERDLDSFAWMKELSRAELSYSLRQLPLRPRFKTEPWLHQLVCFYIALHYPRFLFLLDMGLGKSKILLDIISHLIRERRFRRAVIFVPRVINVESWRDDAERHSELEFWSASVTDIEGKRDRLLSPQGDVTLIDYQSMHWALSKKRPEKKGSKKFDLVVDEKLMRHFHKAGYGLIGMDESHKLANHESLWFSIMRQLVKEVEYVYATTGTLFGGPKDIEGIWSQFFLVDGGLTFGKNLGLFRNSFFTATTGHFKTELTYNRRMSKDLHRMIGNRAIRYDEKEVLDLPPRVHVRRQVEMTTEQTDHYMRAVQGILDSGGSLRNLEAPWTRMRQITSGYLAWKDEHGNHIVRFKENPKLDEIERLLDEMGDSKIVIVHEYVETGRIITERLTELGIKHEWYFGGTKDKPAARRRFLDDPDCRAFVMNWQSGGEGTDGLQKVARYMVLYESPSSPKARQQTIKRISRHGQEKRSFFYDLCCRKTIDIGILDEADLGRDLFESVVNQNRRTVQKFLVGA